LAGRDNLRAGGRDSSHTIERLGINRGGAHITAIRNLGSAGIRLGGYGTGGGGGYGSDRRNKQDDRRHCGGGGCAYGREQTSDSTQLVLSVGRVRVQFRDGNNVSVYWE
jgi:hypothetical protein